jgi:hypothetical protein
VQVKFEQIDGGHKVIPSSGWSRGPVSRQISEHINVISQEVYNRLAKRDGKWPAPFRVPHKR